MSIQNKLWISSSNEKVEVNNAFTYLKFTLLHNCQKCNIITHYFTIVCINVNINNKWFIL